MQTLEKEVASVETQATFELENANEVETTDASTSTDDPVNSYFEAEVQTDDLAEKLHDERHKFEFDEQNLVDLSTQTSLSYFERLSKDSQTDEKSSSEEPENSDLVRKELKADQDLTIDCVSCETQTVCSPFTIASQTRESDSGLGQEETTSRTNIGTQTDLCSYNEESCQTERKLVLDSSSQTILEDLSLFSFRSSPSANESEPKCVFTQTEKLCENTSASNATDDYCNKIKAIVMESNESLKELMLKFHQKVEENEQTIAEIARKNDASTFDDIASELGHFQDSFLKVIADNTKISEEEISHLAEFLANIQAKLLCLEMINQQITGLNDSIKTVAIQNEETKLDLKENLENLTDYTSSLQENMSKIVAREISIVKPELLALGKRSEINEEAILSILDQLQSNVHNFRRSAETNKINLDELKDCLQDLSERFNRQDGVYKDFISAEKQKQEEQLNEVSSQIEQIARNNDSQLQRNLKTSLRNLDATVGENFEIIQNMMSHLRDDLNKKMNEVLIVKAREKQSRELDAETMSADIEKMTATLSNLKTTIESKASESSKNLFDKDIVEAIRGGNDQALIAIQAQGKSILKTVETCNKLLKDVVTLGLNSESNVWPEREREAYQNSLSLQKEHFIKEIETMERQNSALEEFLLREKKYTEEEKVKRKGLESDIKSLREENQALKESNIQLKMSHENLKHKYEDLFSKNIVQTQLECGNKADNLHHTSNKHDFMPGESQNNSEYATTSETIRKLESDLKKEQERNLWQEANRMKIIEEMNQERSNYTQQIVNLQNKIKTKEIRILALEGNFLSERDTLQADNLENETENEKRLLAEMTVLKEKKRTLEIEIKNKDRLVRELKERIGDLEIIQKDLEMDLNIRTTQTCELKSETLLLQKKIKSLGKSLEEQVYDDKLSAILRQRNEELEKEVFQNQSLILNLKERVRTLSQEKAELTREIALYKEGKIFSDVLLKQKEEAEDSLRKLQNEFAKMKHNIEEEFIPRSKLESLYLEMETHFGALLTKRLYDCQKPMVENLRTLEHANGILKGREEALKIEIQNLLDQIKVISAKANVSSYNAHLWKSKYQKLLEERHQKNSSNPVPVPTPKPKSSPDGDILEDINALLNRPYEDSAFLNKLIDLPSSLGCSNALPEKPSPFRYQSTPAKKDPQSADIEKHLVLDCLEVDLKKYLPAERDSEPLTSTPKVKISSPKTPKSPPAEPLQQSIDSYVNFLRKNRKDF